MVNSIAENAAEVRLNLPSTEWIIEAMTYIETAQEAILNATRSCEQAALYFQSRRLKNPGTKEIGATRKALAEAHSALTLAVRAVNVDLSRLLIQE